ncbi:hypothetical protein B5X24_HaOG215088 [Helicoverpa armigera]|uniref:Uncharacterized protein n=1 Tax=Helicoverpa armigera TaxID=29058 RepID=A0A2W1B0R0_HELAM|nr:hypothetical protein B5X24_HaOG215088 [Helicoverpa armigera]
MERMFDSDDSARDPTYNPDPDSLLRLEDLFGEQWANNKNEDSDNMVRFPENDHCIDEVIPPFDGDVLIPQVLPISDSHQAVISLWELLLRSIRCNSKNKTLLE